MLVKYLRALLNQFAKKSDLGLYAKKTDFTDGTIKVNSPINYAGLIEMGKTFPIIAPKDGVLVASLLGSVSNSCRLMISNKNVAGIYTASGSTLIAMVKVSKGERITASSSVDYVNFYPYK